MEVILTPFLYIDVSSFGNSRQDALANLDEVLSLYFEDVKPFRN